MLAVAQSLGIGSSWNGLVLAAFLPGRLWQTDIFHRHMDRATDWLHGRSRHGASIRGRQQSWWPFGCFLGSHPARPLQVHRLSHPDAWCMPTPFALPLENAKPHSSKPASHMILWTSQHHQGLLPIIEETHMCMPWNAPQSCPLWVHVPRVVNRHLHP